MAGSMGCGEPGAMRNGDGQRDGSSEIGLDWLASHEKNPDCH